MLASAPIWTHELLASGAYLPPCRSNVKLAYVARRDRPLVLIDIDGVISLFGFDAAQPPPGRFLLVDGIPHFLSAGAAELLAGLHEDFELVWCSGWEEKADEYLPLALGLPAGLRHLTFAGAPDGGPARHWKLSAIEKYAGHDRPLAWIDDQFDTSCHHWAQTRAAPTELVVTDPAVGLTPEHVVRIQSWAAGMNAPDGRPRGFTGSEDDAGHDHPGR